MKTVQEKLRAAGVWLYRGWCVAGLGEKGGRGPGGAVRGRGGPRPHSPAQRQLAQAPHAARAEHVILGASSVQHRAEAESHVRAPARGAHLGKGAVEKRAGHPGEGGARLGEGGAWGKLTWRDLACSPKLVFLRVGGRSSPAESGSLSSAARSAPLDAARQRSWDAPCGRTRRGGGGCPS